MTCDETREQLSALIDEALPPSGRTACEAHLAGCADCRRELDRLRQTVAQIRALPAPRVPAGFAERVMAATRAPVGAPATQRPAASPSAGAREPWLQRALHRVFSPLRIKLPLEAAAVLLVGVGAVYLFQHTPELQEATRQYAPPPASAPAPAPPDAAVTAPRGAKSMAGTEQPALRPPAPASPSVAASPAVTAPATPSPSALPAERREAPEPKVQGRAQEAASAPRSQMEGARAFEAPGKEDAARDTARADQRAFIQRKAEEAPGSAERQRAPARDITARQAPAPPSAPPGAAPPAEAPQAMGPPRVGQIAAPSTRSGAELAAKMAAAPRLVGRLGVADRLAADRALGELLGRVGGRELLRRAEGGELVIEVALPEGAYAPFVEGLTRIGRWQPDAEPAPGVEPLQLALRLTEVR